MLIVRAMKVYLIVLTTLVASTLAIEPEATKDTVVEIAPSPATASEGIVGNKEFNKATGDSKVYYLLKKELI